MNSRCSIYHRPNGEMILGTRITLRLIKWTSDALVASAFLTSFTLYKCLKVDIPIQLALPLLLSTQDPFPHFSSTLTTVYSLSRPCKPCPLRRSQLLGFRNVPSNHVRLFCVFPGYVFSKGILNWLDQSQSLSAFSRQSFVDSC